jgi:alpha-ketoglutaric semialdehyde dehydrogenase
MTEKLTHFINGVEVAADTPHESRNPSDTNDVVARFPDGGADEVDAGAQAARAAFPAWSQASPEVRSDLLDRIGTTIMARSEELGRLLSREEGKTVPEGTGEVMRAARIFKYFAGEALRRHGRTLDSTRPGIDVETHREAVGVFGLITPWNFPIAIPAWKIAPALAFGNCVVFKPATLVPASAWALTEIIARAGLPEGVFNLVMGAGGTVGDVLSGVQGADAITFTGSDTVGRALAAKAVAGGQKIQLEMGGKNPLLVLDDADLETALHCAVQGAYFSTGQRCTASSRLIVTAGLHDRFVEALAQRLGALKVDHALAPGTDIGPVVSQAQLDQDLHYLRLGQQEGAQLLCGGQCVERGSNGFYLTPALFVATHNQMRINREEIFGPVATVIRVADFEEALAVANDTPFGLVAGIVTSSLRHAEAFKEGAEAGMVMVNLPTAGVDYHVPFGGRKGSSYGPREQGSYAREFYTTVKTAYTKAGR